MASLNPFHYLGEAYNYVTGQDQKGPPGAAGKAGVNDSIVYDPQTGLFVDRTNGQSYADQNGTMPVATPNAAQQIGQNNATQSQLMQQAAAYAAREQAAYEQQQQVAQSLKGTINGTVPSVAEIQLQQTLGQIQGQQLAQAAGASGQDAVLAHLAAMSNTQKAQVAANQTGALLRAQETSDAQKNLGNLDTSMAQQSSNLYGTDLSGAYNYANADLTGEGNREGQQQAVDKSNTQNRLAGEKMIGEGLGLDTDGTKKNAAASGGSALV